jgi:hypothetical protein
MQKITPYNREKTPEKEKKAETWCQRYCDRRRQPSKGFAYISTVGWICRRERIRRKDD